jgi:hypothetical protein
VKTHDDEAKSVLERLALPLDTTGGEGLRR